MLYLRMKRWLLPLAAPLLTGATYSPIPVAVPPGQDVLATARLVKSILEYTRWPQRRAAIDLCVVGQSGLGESFPYAVLDNGIPIRRRSLGQLDFDATQGCDALYLGRIDLDRARQWNARVRGAPVVTIAEQDSQCVSEAMICLIYGKKNISFQLNIDAVARSKVRIDPRVFRMSRGF